MRYVSNGTTVAYVDGGPIPTGCHEISEEEYTAARAAKMAEIDQRTVDANAARNVVKASAKAKLLAGERLNEEEIDLLLG
jgi:hypothetical protein